MQFFNDLKLTLRNNIRDYGMYIALAVIFITFTITTGGLFLTPNNIFNLIQQTGYIAVLAVGMTLVIVIRHIDLSVGSIAGFVGAVAAALLVTYDLPSLLVIPIVLAVGSLAGLLTGVLVARVGIPAFVASLGGMFVYKGFMFQTLSSTGTLGINDPIIRAIGSGSIPEIARIAGLHLLTMIIGLIVVGLFTYSEIRNRKVKQKYNFEVLPMNLFRTKLFFVAGVILGFTYLLAASKGFSWTLVIVIVVVSIYHFVTSMTVLGRHIYAVRGNPEAAELSGISVKFITYVVFSSMGLLSALAGIMYAARINSATLTAGAGFELQAIAGAFIGGVSASGGVGKVTGSIIGALVMASLSNGMTMMSYGPHVKDVVSGAVLVAAVVFDVKTRNMKKKSASSNKQNLAIES